MTADINALRDAFAQQFGRPPTIISEAPGRVNLIGEHTDYNEGFALPVVIDRTVAVAAAPTDGGTVRVDSADFDARDEWPVDAPRRTRRQDWRDYVRGVAWALLDAGKELRGADLVIAGDVPQGSGLSSSAALEMAVAGAFCAVSGIEIDPRALALLSQKAENQFVGVQCGIMDQLAVAQGRPRHAILIDCRSLDMEHVPLPPEVAIIVVDSGVPRRLEATAYNERRKECEEAARLLGVHSLRDVSIEDIATKRHALPDLLYRRARHVITENGRVGSFVKALRACDCDTLGRVMYESHQSLSYDFEVSTSELDRLVELASRTEGVIGARLTGAGLGGCTVNLVREGGVGRFAADVVERYRRETGLNAKMHVCKAADGLKVRNA